MTTGFNPATFGEFTAAATKQANQIQSEGEAVKASIANLTTEGLQGASAGASDQMANEVNTVTATAKDTVAQLQARAADFGQNLTNSDRSFASRIGG